MPTPHNEALKDEIAKTVIMPGDPLRAKYIAEKYLEDYKLVNEVRAMYAYTGYYKGKRVTVMAHGMGNPSIGIYSYELYKEYDVDEIIRIGSAGATTKSLPLRSVVLVDKSYSKSSYAKIQNNSSNSVLKSDDELNQRIIKTAQDLNLNLIKANVYCSDAFYNETEDPNVLFNEYGCVAIEMESFALFHNAFLLGKKATCILTISDNVVTKEELSSYDRQNGFDDMIKLALESTLIK